VEGNPNTPLPITEFTTSAVRLQRPMARTSWRLDVPGGSVSGIAWFYHKWATAGFRQCSAPDFVQAGTAEGGRLHMITVTFDSG
jgi:hypothetical protein